MMSFRNVFGCLIMLLSSIAVHSRRYRRIDPFCIGRELTLLPKELFWRCGATVSINDVHIPPTVQYGFSQSLRNRRYILIVIDPDMHFIEKYSSYSHRTDHLHWMKLNFSAQRLAEGVTSESSDLHPYSAPGPSLANRRIQFLLYEQRSDNVVLPYPTGRGKRFIDVASFEWRNNYREKFMSFQYVLTIKKRCKSTATKNSLSYMKSWLNNYLLKMVILYFGKMLI
ncbi:uncharacterized protein LOC106869962 [Octopus bimaculoides]|uniref:Uncharacterized protein n=1 Tax=Octopus bimaculoides TaxID=37653 RepID=A0A0L8HLH9_OCTBM|nr:uncharacterized protein LOC106869962 [Octopus bimaculoides]|eukprot:XP_014771393.1 PREDICTED: uncharacterized protein LOC106869962 [Octopus bimaculoides]